jgi:hypothetical protein
MMNIISMFEAFEFVASITAFDYVLGHYSLMPCFTLVVEIAP